jgi:hypothetical protein
MHLGGEFYNLESLAGCGCAMPIEFLEQTPQQEAEAVVRTESSEHEQARKPGDAVFLVSAEWFTAWCHYTGYAYDPVSRKLAPSIGQDQPGPRPGPIDNSNLVDVDAGPGDLDAEELAAAVPLRAGLVERSDFWALHEATWNFLKDKWVPSVVEGGVALCLE